MPPWIRHFRDWAIPDLFGGLRRPATPTSQGLVISYEKAGVVVRQEPVPWNADHLRVEALLRVPVGILRRKTDFSLHCDGQIVGPELLQVENGNVCRLGFSLEPPRRTSVVELRWREQSIGQAVAPILREEDFFDHLHLTQPTVAVQLAGQMTACEAYLSSQGKVLLAGGVLSSPTSLAPLAGQELRIELTDKATGKCQTASMRLTAQQLSQRETLWQSLMPRARRSPGVWFVQWMIGERSLARRELRVMGRRSVAALITCMGTQYLRRSSGGVVELLRHLSAAAPSDWLGVAFLLRAKEAGLALTAPFQVFLRRKNGQREAVPLFHEEVLVTDGPTPLLPPLLSGGELADVAGFELVCNGRVLGQVSTSPTPEAHFSAEGGFQDAPDEFPWSPASDAELMDRLKKLAEQVG